MNAERTSDTGWETQLRKGWLDLAVLATLWGGRRYGLEILRELEERSDLVVAEGTVYPVLRRLKDDGLVDSEWEDAETGHPRKYYRLTPLGRRRARSMAQDAVTFLGGIRVLLEPLLKENP